MGRKAVDIATKRTIILLRASGMSQHEISRKLNISRNCIHQTINKFNKLHTVATKSGAGRRSKLTDRQKRAIKLQEVRDDTLSLNDLIRYVQTSFNITVSRRTVSRILNQFGMFSYIAPRKPRINDMLAFNGATNIWVGQKKIGQMLYLRMKVISKYWIGSIYVDFEMI